MVSSYTVLSTLGDIVVESSWDFVIKTKYIGLFSYN